MKQKNAVVTGAGSGVGRAVAFELANQGWNVALVGRRKEALEKTASLAGAKRSGKRRVFLCDVGKIKSVEKLAARVLKQLGTVDVLVNSAGMNVPERALEVLSSEDYHAMIATNLNGPYYMVQAFLPAMRKAGVGTIVNIGSDAGLQASAKSGPAYVMSKFGLRGLTQAINAEEREHGIRACSILPGDIDTPLLNKRPEPPTDKARMRMLRPEDLALCVMLAINLPPHAILEELLIRPR